LDHSALPGAIRTHDGDDRECEVNALACPAAYAGYLKPLKVLWPWILIPPVGQPAHFSTHHLWFPKTSEEFGDIIRFSDLGKV